MDPVTFLVGWTVGLLVGISFGILAIRYLEELKPKPKPPEDPDDDKLQVEIVAGPPREQPIDP